MAQLMSYKFHYVINKVLTYLLSSHTTIEAIGGLFKWLPAYNVPYITGPVIKELIALLVRLLTASQNLVEEGFHRSYQMMKKYHNLSPQRTTYGEQTQLIHAH